MKRLELVDGAQVEAPSPGTVSDAVRTLSPRIEFVVLRETAGGFVQAAWGPSVDLPEGSYVLETAGEHVDEHVRAEVTDVDQLVAAFLGFLDGDRGWVDTFAWTPWTT
ncbi:hypothetical protein [Nocardioides baculatus]|uniref:Uncharacterized protein n=1 Tax=Nocardioides baculatus TaxID=2801337 RepID=A0ABS1LCJ6_9ACTN|nr:hypothetical protein [Nocardioides baculatus]MBL0749267.1 hypothetical protein [Nocardioides baculatus]